MFVFVLTLRLPSTTIVPNANSFDLDETLSNSASHPDPNCLTLGQHCHQFLVTLKHFENWKQTRKLADDNLFRGLRVKKDIHAIVITPASAKRWGQIFFIL